MRYLLCPLKFSHKLLPQFFKLMLLITVSWHSLLAPFLFTDEIDLSICTYIVPFKSKETRTRVLTREIESQHLLVNLSQNQNHSDESPRDFGPSCRDLLG